MNLLLFCGGLSSDINNSEINPTDIALPSDIDSQQKSNETSLARKGNSENIGLAVFKQDKLVGELDALETLTHLIVTNQMENCNISVPDPTNEAESIDLFLYNQSKPKIEVELVNGSPYITFKVSLTARVLSVSASDNYSNEQTLKEVSNSASLYMKEQISDYFYKTSKEFNSDIGDIGKYALSNFWTQSDWNNYNWLEQYKDAFFNVDVDVTVKSAQLLAENH